VPFIVNSGSKPSGPQKFVVSSEGELKSSPAPPPPKPSVVLSQAAGIPSAKKQKLLSGTPSSVGQQQSSQSTGGGLFSNPIRLPQQSQSAGNPAGRVGKGHPPGPKSAMQSSTSSQIMPMDGELFHMAKTFEGQNLCKICKNLVKVCDYVPAKGVFFRKFLVFK